MVMPLCGTFDYVATVPEHPEGDDFECRAQLREEIDTTGSDLRDSRLVGTAPVIRIADAGLTPDAGPHRPSVRRSRITIRATRRRQATVAKAWFHVDKALTARMEPGDEIHLARTSCAGLGLSVLRGGELVYAVGAITAVPLGRSVRAHIPSDLIANAAALFRERDPDFSFSERPIEVSVGNSTSILQRGFRTLGDCEVHILHGFVDGIPGTDECGALYRIGHCSDVAVHASAMLIDQKDALSMSKWWTSEIRRRLSFQG